MNWQAVVIVTVTAALTSLAYGIGWLHGREAGRVEERWRLRQ